MTMNCAVCGFNNEPLPSEPVGTHCAGCGTRISGGDKPFPGKTIDPDRPDTPHEPDYEPLVVDDELRAQFPYRDVDDVILVIKSTYHWGRGIGMEPDGYMTDELVTVEENHEPCEACGHTERRCSFSNGRAGIAKSWEETCTRCETTLLDEFEA